jgi:D-3-phosphoglycerate dehydrogenase
MLKVLFIDSVHPLIKEELSSMGFQCDYFPGYGRKELEAVVAGYEGIIIRSRIILDKAFLDQAPGLKFIGRVGSGMENIDVEYAKSRGVACLNSPEGNRDAVGEHALGMLLNLVNHINRADRQIRQGKWIREGNRGTEIMGKVIGIIGYGNTGGAFAKKLKGFEAEVIACDKYKTGFSDACVKEVSIDELQERCDIASFHVPLTAETWFMADEHFFSGFRMNIILINTSRGQVVKTSALVSCLKSGKITAAALDVLEYEDASFEDIKMDMPADLEFLLNAENVLLTPHIAGWTVESNIKLARALVEKIKAVLY